VSVLRVEVVVNAQAGGFSLCREAGEWLRDERGWKLIPVEEAPDIPAGRRSQGGPKLPPELMKALAWGFGAYRPLADGAAFRMDRDLVDCVRALQERLAGQRVVEPGFGHGHDIFKLEVRAVEVALDIEDYHAGRERVRLVGLAGC
jgi:hypothetical protein